MTNLHAVRDTSSRQAHQRLAAWTLPQRRAGRARRLGTLTATALSVALLGACSGGSVDTADNKATGTTPSPTATLAPLDSQEGATLKDAKNTAKAAGYTASTHNANDSVAEPSGTWTVCFETVDDDAVDFGAVEEGALCPEKDGDPLTWPEAPDVTGTTYTKAIKALTEAGLDEEHISVASAYKDVTVSSTNTEDDPNGYRVCFQSLKAGADIKPGTETTLSLIEGGSCPAKKGTYKDKTNDPNYSPPPAPTSGSGSSGSTGGSSSSSGSTTGGSTAWNGQCELTSPAGNCYRAGQFCANKHLGLSTHDAGGRIIYCKERADGQRWNYS
ncbi:PASTA domain-containing protein [Streptomyces sp. bgisy034]|uniref:PASTA domain-containing protein n=1 Tax=Streptomyces sp. bgisy034 TaxID=3413774 RepID=UPI003EC0279F